MPVKTLSMWGTILISSFIFLPSSEAQIFKWVDSKGTTHYSDQHLGVENFDWVDDNDMIIYLEQPAKTLRKNKTKVLSTPPVPRKTVQRPRKASKDFGPTRRVGGSSSRGSYKRGASYGRNSRKRY